MHSIKRIVRSLDSVNLILKALVNAVNVVRIYIETDFTTMAVARLSISAEHNPAAPKRHHRKTQPIAAVSVGVEHLKPNILVPVDCCADIRHVKHRHCS